MQYFTGNKEHNVELRSMAIDKGMKLNEYGLFRKDTNEVVAREKEEDIYQALGLEIMPPELREDRGEIEAAMRGRLPKLVELSDIKGDFHVHTLASDGSATIEEMAYAAKRKRLRVRGDNRPFPEPGRGQWPQRRATAGQYGHRPQASRRGWRACKVLIGAEVEILEDGKLDYPDDVLEGLDYVIGAVHSKFKMSEEEMTKRLLTAMSNEHLTILAHPTGRVLEQREPYHFDKDEVFQAAKDNESLPGAERLRRRGWTSAM